MTAAFNAAETQILYRVAKTLVQDRDYGELLADLLDAVIEGLGADRGFVVVGEDGHYRAVVARQFGADALHEVEREVSNSIAAAVAGRGYALLIDDASTTEQFRDVPSVRRLGLRSVLCAPLVASEKAFALIYIENRSIPNRFTERQRELLDEMCALSAPRLRVAVAAQHARERAEQLAVDLADTDGIITADPQLGELLKMVRQVATTDLPVLIEGETGTGKELVARAVYRHSHRSQGAFVVVNCGALPASLIESELFGYVRGAFTGANRDKTGLIAAAHRGTLFLDEIGELPTELQPRLLRVVQNGAYMRLGSVREETADVRIVAATNRDLAREVEAGRFRSDLYYRLSGITVNLPPLRSRPHDVRLLAHHFLRAYSVRFGKPSLRLGETCIEALTSHTFPGNVRELEAEIARVTALAAPGSEIEASALSERIRTPRSPERLGDLEIPPMAIEEMERKLIASVLRETNGNRTRAAEILGISREGLRTKMQRLRFVDARSNTPGQG